MSQRPSHPVLLVGVNVAQSSVLGQFVFKNSASSKDQAPQTLYCINDDIRKDMSVVPSPLSLKHTERE
jgi:hypothetical protein